MVPQGPGSVPLAVIDGSAAAEDAYSERSAAQFLEDATARAVADGTSVDVFAVQPSAVNATLLSRLAQTSGGAVVLQEGTVRFFQLFSQPIPHLPANV